MDRVALPVDYEKRISAFLPWHVPWHAEWNVFGDEDSDRIDVVSENGRVQQVRVRLDARIAQPSSSVDPPVFPRSYSDAGGLMSGFVSARPRLLIAGRRHPVPQWATGSVASLLAEDLLVIRHHSGQQAFVAPSADQPGTLVIARRWEDVPNGAAEIRYLRAIS